jgi:hypothetical protein
MASSREYLGLAAECARLARAAPSRDAKASFAAAAKNWLMLACLAEEHPDNITVAIGRLRSGGLLSRAAAPKRPGRRLRLKKSPAQ